MHDMWPFFPHRFYLKIVLVFVCDLIHKSFLQTVLYFSLFLAIVVSSLFNGLVEPKLSYV